jgi:biotin synthase-related radical SAM superfamily protein
MIHQKTITEAYLSFLKETDMSVSQRLKIEGILSTWINSYKNDLDPKDIEKLENHVTEVAKYLPDDKILDQVKKINERLPENEERYEAVIDNLTKILGQ